MSTWTPAALAPTAWYDVPTSYASTSVDTPLAGTVPDRSGNGYDLVPWYSEPGGTAVVKAAGIGGRPSIALDTTLLSTARNNNDPARFPFDPGSVTILAVMRDRVGITPDGELLSQPTRDLETAGGVIQSGSATYTRSTGEVAAHSGNYVARVTVPASTATNDSYIQLGVNGRVGGTSWLILKPGHSYTLSYWVRVPAATGLSPAGYNATYFARAAVFWRVGSGAYQNVAAPGPTALDTWQQRAVSFAIPASASESFVRLYNGALYSAASPQPVYYDDLSLIDNGPAAPVVGNAGVIAAITRSWTSWTAGPSFWSEQASYLIDNGAAGWPSGKGSAWVTPAAFFADQAAHSFAHASDGTNLGHSASYDGAGMVTTSLGASYQADPGSSPAVGYLNVGGLNIGAMAAQGRYYFLGQLSELVVVPRKITARERADWDTYVRDKYGSAITVADYGFHHSTALAGAAALAPAAHSARHSTASLAGLARLVPAVHALHRSSLTLAASAGLAVVGHARRHAAGSWAASASLAAPGGEATRRSSPTFAGAAALHAAGHGEGRLDLAGSATLQLDGHATRHAAPARLTGSATIEAAGHADRRARVALSGDAELQAAGHSTRRGELLLVEPAVAYVAAHSSRHAALQLAGDVELQAAGRRLARVGFDLESVRAAIAWSSGIPRTGWRSGPLALAFAAGPLATDRGG